MVLQISLLRDGVRPMSKRTDLLPILPLHTVLFPGSVLPLKIFEPRYTDMISHCMKTESNFGICLIRTGDEIGEAAKTYEVGTVAKITDWHLRSDGLLGITILGEERFRILSETIQSNQLLVAEIEYIEEEPRYDLPSQFEGLADYLPESVVSDSVPGDSKERNIDDPRWLGFRLADHLPLKLSQKQYFLQLSDPFMRLQGLSELLDNLNQIDKAS